MPLKTFMNYKAVFLTSFAPLILFTHGVKAQAQNNEQRFRAGLTLGPVASDLHGTDTRDSDSDFQKLGFCFGALVSSKLSEKNTLQLEINYIQKGALQKPDSLNMGYFRMSLNYIEVPLVYRHKMHMNIRKKPVDVFDIEAGASFARLINFSYNVDNYLLKMDQSKLNSYEVSLLVGLNYNVTPQLSFGIRYSNSVTPAIKRNSIPAQFFYYAFNSGNNQVVLFSARYVFGGQKKKSDNPTPPPADKTAN